MRVDNEYSDRSLDAGTGHFGGDVRPVMCRQRDIGVTGEIAFSEANNAAAVQRRGVLRVDDQRFLIIGERLVEEILAEIDRAAALESKFGAQLDLDRPRDVLDREIVEAEQLVAESAVVVRVSELG